jgi:hypothetical protein
MALLALLAIAVAALVSSSSGSSSSPSTDEGAEAWNVDDTFIALTDAAACLRAHGARVTTSSATSVDELRVELPGASPLTLRFFASAYVAAAAGGPHPHNVGYGTPDGTTSPVQFEAIGQCVA